MALQNIYVSSFYPRVLLLKRGGNMVLSEAHISLYCRLISSTTHPTTAPTYHNISLVFLLVM